MPLRHRQPARIAADPARRPTDRRVSACSTRRWHPFPSAEGRDAPAAARDDGDLAVEATHFLSLARFFTRDSTRYAAETRQKRD